MEEKDDVIFTEEVLEIFDHKISYGALLNLIREKKIPAMKAGRRYIFSRRVVENFKNKQLGVP